MDPSPTSLGNPEAAAVPRPRPTVFLSYASEDRRAAQLIRDSLPAYGMEVWYDESDLVGGDAWDQKIRRQIRECDYFMPVISAHTEARHEGYFRREWRLAVERTLDMADDHVFLLPVVIDQTTEAGARVPEKFRAVQWLRLPDGQPTAALEAVCRRLASGESSPRPSDERPRTARVAAAPATGAAPPPEGAAGAMPMQFPPFPRAEPGQRVRFWFQVVGWALQSGWAAFKRFPKWLRIVIYVWALILLVSRGCTPSHGTHTSRLSAAQTHKLADLGATNTGGWTAADTARLIGQVAKEFPASAGDDSSTYAAVLAIPFAVPAGDSAAQKVASSVFGQLYGRLAISRHGHVALADQPLPTLDASAAVAQGRAQGSSYIVCGAVAGSGPDQQLTVKIIAVKDGSVSWSESYPVAGADAADIAEDVSDSVPRHEDD